MKKYENLGPELVKDYFIKDDIMESNGINNRFSSQTSTENLGDFIWDVLYDQMFFFYPRDIV